MEWEYSSSLTVTCDENKRYLMAGLQRSKPFDVDLAGHVRRCCVAGGLRRMVRTLSLLPAHYIEDKTHQSRLHILSANIEVIPPSPRFRIVVMYLFTSGVSLC